MISSITFAGCFTCLSRKMFALNGSPQKKNRSSEMKREKDLEKERGIQN